MGFEELQVKITTQEERWALRYGSTVIVKHKSDLTFSPSLVNMLACLKCLLAEGLTVSVSTLTYHDLSPERDGYQREVPVFGIINDQVVVGIIVSLWLP